MPWGWNGFGRGRRRSARLLAVACLALPLAAGAQRAARPAPAAPAPKTVCTITVNSADEKEAFQRQLPASRWRFVELVERGRPDWLASSCRAGVRCDVLVISGHFDGVNEFFSDRLEVREYLPVAELERASCSGSCPGLFSQLKEVHLYGCNTLNPAPLTSASDEVVRSLVREGHSPKEARRQLQSLTAAHGETSRDRMRQIFAGVPVIYGFASTAPLGPVAGPTLERFLRSGGTREIASGHPSGRLLGAFGTFGMAAAEGLDARDPDMAARADMCRFADDRLGTAQKLGFVHELLQRHMGEPRLYLDRIRRLVASIDETGRAAPDIAQEFADIAEDTAARDRFLAYARQVDEPPVRVRMVDVARDLGWLDEGARWQELAQMLGELLARPKVGPPEVDLACRLNANGDLDGAFNRRVVSGGPTDDVPHAAVRACLGSDEGHARTLAALVSTEEADVRVAQAYLRHRPLADGPELRRVADGIAAMAPGDAQVRALETLGRHYLGDREVLARLTRLFADTPSWEVQTAIAGILIRADRKALAEATVERTVSAERLAPPKGKAGPSMIDALLQRLQAR
jgi:hypothetical protein